MSIGTELAQAAKSAGAAFNLATDLVNDKPGRLARLFLAFAPEAAVNWVMNRRLRLAQIKVQEDLFDLCCKAVLDDYSKAAKKAARSVKGARNPALIHLLEQMEGDLRLLGTVKRSLAFLPEDGAESSGAGENDLSWWSIFEDFARRPNEEWRIDLLAKAVAANETEPGAIRLKALWEIGMLEADDFGMLALFCDCAVHLDGKPLVILDPEEQNEFAMELDDGRVGNLAHIIADLVDRRLVQKALTQFETTEPVRLDHLSGPHFLHHKLPPAEGRPQSMIQLAAYGPTDYGLDLCRLYTAHFNEASDANFESLQRSLEEGFGDEETAGTVEFRSPADDEPA